MVPRVPHPLFDKLIKKYKLKNDAQLAQLLSMNRTHLSLYRSGKRVIGPQVILDIHDATDWPIKRIKGLLK